MINNQTKHAADSFSERLKFLKTWMKEPKTVGSVWPTSPYMAGRMASVIDIKSGLPVLELGAGVGTITKAILDKGLPPEKLFSVEYTDDFVNILRGRFPKINVVHGDAYALGNTLGTNKNLIFDCAVSGLPLLNMPKATRLAFVKDVLRRLPKGRPLIQFSYGPFPPVPALAGSFTTERYDFVLRNLPPGQLWVYRQI